MSESSDRDKLAEEVSRIDSQMAALAELKRQYLARLSVADSQELSPVITKQFSPEEKISLFRSYFRGREDVHARRWENRTGKSGYSPACKNEWDRVLCRKPAVRCVDCQNREFLPFDENMVRKHLEGKLVAGVYPLLSNDTCFFLAMDFDGDSWLADIASIRETCAMEKVPAAVERSRSGNGGHVWIFFSEEVPASLARRLGTCLISKTMVKRCQLAIKSYDRLFPNQDIMPQGGFGNLIALPLQKEAALAGNSVFINETSVPYPGQWAYLASVKKLSRAETEALVAELEKTGGRIPARWSPIEEEDEPWTRPPSGKRRFNVNINDLPASIEVVLSNRVYVKTENIPSALVNQLKHLAAFHNPEFYKKQKMRFSTHATPRIICCAELDAGWLSMPRGCLEDLKMVLSDYGVKLNLENKRFPGKKIDHNFLGTLNPLQQAALDDILPVDFGVLSAPPGSGKTVIALLRQWLIARSTLLFLCIEGRLWNNGGYRFPPCSV
jgi:hypothetical protein